MRPALLGRLYPYMDSIQKQPPLYLANFFRVEEQDRSSPLFSHLPRWQLTAKLKALYSRETRAALAGYDAFDELQESLPSQYSSWPSFCQAQYLEMKYLLPGYLLSAQADRMAMAHSVEARYPFLDHRVLEFCQKLSPALKMKVLNEKYLLKRAAATLLPDSILRRPKQPYRAPDGASFAGTRPPEYVADTLSNEGILRTGIFEPSPVQKLVTKFAGSNHPSARDNMALVGAISTQLLIHQFVAPGRLAATTYAIN
jgi:asparagine synthase (glutamine-hydrolysing)